MQLIATILAVFFLSLIVLPCADGTPDECGVEVHFHPGQGHDHEQEPHADFCSPFCSCHCCHTHFIVKNFNILSSEIEYIETLIPYISHRYPQASPAIWQPPRV